MAGRRAPAWVEQMERFGLKSIIKLILSVFFLWFFLILVSFLPGTERLSATLAVPFTALVSAAVTLAILVLLYEIATRANRLIVQLETDSPEVRDGVAALVYWGVILFAIAIAYEGFRGAGQGVFARAGFGVFYPLFFVVMAMIPLTLLLVEVGALVQARRRRTVDFKLANSDLQSDAERVRQILEVHDGRIKQGEFSAMTNWSEGKVSRVISDMESDGLLHRYQLGREKIVCLPGAEPDFVSSGGPDSPNL